MINPVPVNMPTARSMKFKFPEFREIDDGTIELALEEAFATCDGDWVDEANRALGITYYTAHLLKVSQMYAASGASGGLVSSERIGELSVSYSVPDQNKTIDFTMTPYGERFLSLLRQNFPAVLTVNSAVRM